MKIAHTTVSMHLSDSQAEEFIWNLLTQLNIDKSKNAQLNVREEVCSGRRQVVLEDKLMHRDLINFTHHFGDLVIMHIGVPSELSQQCVADKIDELDINVDFADYAGVINLNTPLHFVVPTSARIVHLVH